MGAIKVDVCVVEKNASKTLERCLQSIQKFLPYNRLIIVDGNSTDGSLAIAKKYADTVQIDSGYLGRVRYRAAELASTNWIIFIDSDTYIYPQWFENVKPYLADNKVGLVIGLSDHPCVIPIYREYADYVFWLHGATSFHNMVVRRDLILSCTELLHNVHAGEDWIVRKHAENLGFKTITIKKTLSYHDKEMIKGAFNGYFRWGQSYRLLHTPRKALYLGYLSYIRYQGIDWMNFSRTRKLSLTALYLLALLGLRGFYGILRGPDARTPNTIMK